MRDDRQRARLEACGRRLLGWPGTLVSADTTELTGGYTPATVHRHDLTFQLAEGGQATVRVVQKHTSAYEVRVMRTVAAVRGLGAVPPLLDEDAGPDAGWFVVPYYDGRELTWQDEVPSLVVESLASLHVHFLALANWTGWFAWTEPGYSICSAGRWGTWPRCGTRSRPTKKRTGWCARQGSGKRYSGCWRNCR